MNITKLRTLMGSCCYLLLAFSLSVNAADAEQVGSGMSIESWLAEGGRDIPVLSFDNTRDHGELAEDIQVENITRDTDGSTRFQLSSSGPMSRQVFANVRRVEQDNGYTRSIITNIADGQQMEYLTLTTEVIPVNQLEKAGMSGLLAESGVVDDQHIECPWCPIVAGILLSEAICTLNTHATFHRCKLTCQYLGGVKYFNTGVCGTVMSECVCWIRPKRESREF